MKPNISINNYNEMLREIIAEVKMTRVVIANRLNASVTQLYWNIGKRLSSEKMEKGYGGKVVEQLSVDLKSEFPDTEGFSPRSLWDMKRLYEFYSDENDKLPQVVAEWDLQKLPQPVAVLPWGHNRLILSKINHYLGLLDDQMKMHDENPSIGIILCAEKDNINVEVALRDFHKPIGVAEYQTIFPEEEIKLLINRELNL